MVIDKEMRKRIDNLLAVYLNHLEQHQAGWHSENDLQRLADYKGDLPPPSGFDRSNAFMIGALNMTRERHAQLNIIQWLLGMPEPCPDCSKESGSSGSICSTCSGLGVTIRKGQIKPEYSLVLLAERYWQQDPAHVVCGRLGLSVKQYVGRLSKARSSLGGELEKVDDIRRLLLIAKMVA